jgi:hypothetical protein
MATNENMHKAVAEAIEGELLGKKWYYSKTFWTNVVVGAAVIVQASYGFIFPVEYQMLALSFINMGLRKITNEPVVW